MTSIPERRDAARGGPARPEGGSAAPPNGDIVVWRCKVCGYLCARRGPPAACPICHATKERFERFPVRLDR